MPPSALLLDIEGTTTPIDFVSSVLFPYARRHLPEFVARHTADADVAAALAALEGPANRLRRGFGGQEAGHYDPVAYAIHLMEQDVKSTPLKTLQGLIWEDGYARGELRGVVFPDVAPALRRWQAQGRDVRIFSSGSVLAQRLLFSTCAEGDLTPFLRGHFDTTTGSKKDAASYRAIAAAFGVPPARIVFVSDVVDELDAARAAGMATRLAVRPGNAPVPDTHGHQGIVTFSDL